MEQSRECICLCGRDFDEEEFQECKAVSNKQNEFDMEEAEKGQDILCKNQSCIF